MKNCQSGPRLWALLCQDEFARPDRPFAALEIVAWPTREHPNEGRQSLLQGDSTSQKQVLLRDLYTPRASDVVLP